VLAWLHLVSHMTGQLDRLKTALSDRYAIEREIGSGGMATVYLAEDLTHERQVALKVLRPELAAVLGGERFLNEIKVTANLHHPHILALYDSGEADGFLYYVMPYVEGESLGDRLEREKQLAIDDALQVAREVADALSYAHAHGVIHRDIKPENILLESGHAVVADFGIARAIDQAGGESLTATGLAVGTPAYMSPEQAAGSKDLDGRSDLYSLGCVLYEMLAGEPPFTGPTVESLVHQHLSVEPPSVTAIRPAVPSHVAATLERALSKTPADRFNPVALFAEALGPRASAALAPTPAAPAPPVAGRFSWERIALLAIVTAAAIAGAVAFGRSIWPSATGSIPPRTAIAVLPFQNLSGDPEQEYFVDGMHDALISELAQIRALSVRSRTSVMQYKNTMKSMPQIAEELGADMVVEGTAFKLGDTVRIQAQLIQAATDDHLWAETYDRSLGDILSLHSEVARAIAEEVQATLTPQEEARLTASRSVNPDAYQAYLRGRYMWTEGKSEQSIDRFLRALEIDSTFALGYVGLGNAHITAAHGDIPPREAFPIAIEAAQRALSFDDGLAEAHTITADAKYHWEHDWVGAEEGFHQAITLSPGYALAHEWYAGLLSALGRHDEAIASIKRAQELDPLGRVHYYLAARFFLFARLPERAEEELQHMVALDPDWSGVRWTSARLYLQTGRYVEAIVELQEMVRIHDDPGLRVDLAWAYALAGRKAEAAEKLAEVKSLYERTYFSPHLIALVHTALGEVDSAFVWLEEAYHVRDAALVWVNVEAGFDGLRDDARFDDLLRRMKLRE
jgi:serine/threonine-protein kinase